MNFDLGTVNGTMLSRLMIGIVREAIELFAKLRQSNEVVEKPSIAGTGQDIYTTVDLALQLHYVSVLSGLFPEFGIIAEEVGYKRSCTRASGESHFTIDAIDGTKAFVREQADNVGTMIALTHNGSVISAWIGDLNNGDIFGYSYGEPIVYLIQKNGVHRPLNLLQRLPLAESFIHCGDEAHQYPEPYVQLLNPETRPFKGMIITRGSIGIQMTRLWKGEVGAILLNASHNTPWDWNPIIGISLQLGFFFLSWDSDQEKFLVQSASPILETSDVGAPFLVIHKSRLAEFNQHMGYDT